MPDIYFFMKPTPFLQRTTTTVVAMTVTQAIAVLVLMTIPVMATEIASDFGVNATDIAPFMSLVFFAAMFSSAASGSFIQKFGGIRANQIGMAFSACCLLLALPVYLPLLFFSALLIGLGYGPNTPAGSHILNKTTPPQHRGFVFSLKQSGAPLGGLICGLLVPFLVTHLGWQSAIWATIGIAFFGVIAIQPLRKRLDQDRNASLSLEFISPRTAVESIIWNTPLRSLTSVAVCLTTIQSAVMAFMVIYLVQKINLSFPTAGAIFALSQASGAITRVGVGWLADRKLGAKITLILMGVCSALSIASLSLMDTNSPHAAIITNCVLLGCFSFGWNGVFLAEVANISDPKEVGVATGGSLFFIYGGMVFGPILMSALIRLSGNYVLPFFLIATVTILACLFLLPNRAGKLSI